MSRKNDEKVGTAAVVMFLAFVGLALWFGTANTGQATVEYTKQQVQPYEQGIQAQYELYKEMGQTVAQECIRNAPRVSTTKCCTFADVPNSDASCIDWCKQFGADQMTCFRLCQDECKRVAAQHFQTGGTTFGR